MGFVPAPFGSCPTPCASMSSPLLEFGPRSDDLDYKDRPAAFGLAVRDGRLALVRVSKPGQTPWHDLPGGAIDAGETAQQAAVREFGEETGLVVEPGEVLGCAAQFFISDGRPYRNVGPLMIVRPTGEDPALKIEDDHQLVWIEPMRALRILRHDSHAWAVACWIRRSSPESVPEAVSAGPATTEG